ncbi:MAG: hypothetical protein ACLP9L_13630 [Thermoguttaceae bacterium]
MKNTALMLLFGWVGIPGAVSQQQESPVIDGYVTRVASSSDFDVNGYRVICGTRTQTTIGQPQSKEVLSNQGCPQDRLYLGEPVKIYGSVKKKEHAVEAEQIEAQPVVRGEITGSAVIDALPAHDSAGAQPESLIVRADGYRILIGSATTVAWDPPPNSVAAVVPGDWIEYKGKQRADGIIVAESAKLSRTYVSNGDEKLHKKYDFVDPNDPTKGVRVLTGTIRPYQDAAMQARVNTIGDRLVPAYQRALPDTEPARINFRFLVVDKKHWHDALTLPGGIILVPRQVVERMQNDSQLATVLADNISCLLEKQPDRDIPASVELTAVGVGADVVGIFVPGVGLAATAAGVSEEEMMIKAEQQSGRVSLGLLRDAGYDINQAPVAWWLLAASKPEPTSKILLPYRAAYVYRALGENWQTSNADLQKP